jgi:hypothetical protein
VYEIDPPATSFARDQDLVFRCTSCGHSIPIRSDQSGASSTEKPANASHSGFVLRQEGKTYHVRDTAMLQRWIAERRVWVDDEVSEDGGPFQRAGDLKPFEVFFQLVADAQRPMAGVSAAEVPEPQRPSALSGRAPAKAKSGTLFSRPAGLTPTQATEPVAALGPADDETALIEPAAPDPLDAVGLEPEPVEVSEAPTTEAMVEEEDLTFGESIPDESPSPFAKLSPDEPTMDMELEEEDFFSEEATVVHATIGDDDELEWVQTRRSGMLMWWALFLGGLGGAGYFALDWLNAADEAKKSAAVEAPVNDDEPATPDIEPTQDTTDEDAEADAGEAVEEDPADASPEEPATPEAEIEPEKPAAEPAPEATPSAPPPPKASKPSAPAKPNPSREIDRGWAKIDQGAWSAARGHFSKALSVSPGNADARLGMAYVNENEGRIDEAVVQYCRLAATASGDVKNEAAGRLRSLDKECP